MNNKKILLVSVLINVLLLASLVSVIFRTGKTDNDPVTEAHTNPQYELKSTLFEKVGAEESDVVFLGDSITERALWHESFPEIDLVNRGIGSDTSQGVLERMDTVIALNPQKVFLNIGVNDIILNVDREDTLTNIQSIINEMNTELPESELYIQSVFPVRENYSYVNNDEIDELNSSIEELAEDEGLIYIDIGTTLKNEAGGLKSEYTVDGIHLTGDAYMVWVEMLNDYVY
ncbi:GDSL-type esterase/lipase family protein [Alkalibacterium sp. f15]|uniref:GDSL-type esterase/lipase family protein n=1 Tax=Alkalibacterium sp. f15 TaxID=3414029 RepID=UPI003BF859F4